jgi:hypothetical protein
MENEAVDLDTLAAHDKSRERKQPCGLMWQGTDLSQILQSLSEKSL